MDVRFVPPNVQFSVSKDQAHGIAQVLTTVKSFLDKIKDFAVAVFAHINVVVCKTDLKSLIVHVNAIGTSVEQMFNLAGCLPFVCYISSYARQMVGTLQVASGLALGAIGELGKLISNNSDMSGKFQTLATLGLEHVIHGGLNIQRGMGEAFLASCTMGLGNIALIVPVTTHGFKPLFTYGTLVNPKLNLAAESVSAPAVFEVIPPTYDESALTQ